MTVSNPVRYSPIGDGTMATSIVGEYVEIRDWVAVAVERDKLKERVTEQRKNLRHMQRANMRYKQECRGAQRKVSELQGILHDDDPLVLAVKFRNMVLRYMETEGYISVEEFKEIWKTSLDE